MAGSGERNIPRPPHLVTHVGIGRRPVGFHAPRPRPVEDHEVGFEPLGTVDRGDADAPAAHSPRLRPVALDAGEGVLCAGRRRFGQRGDPPAPRRGRVEVADGERCEVVEREPFLGVVGDDVAPCPLE
jgi:hypothetical protein